MTDAELIAMAAFVNGLSAEVNAANDSRKHQGYAMAYDGFPVMDALQALEDELRRRGAIPSPAASSEAPK